MLSCRHGQDSWSLTKSKLMELIDMTLLGATNSNDVVQCTRTVAFQALARLGHGSLRGLVTPELLASCERHIAAKLLLKGSTEDQAALAKAQWPGQGWHTCIQLHSCPVEWNHCSGMEPLSRICI